MGFTVLDCVSKVEDLGKQHTGEQGIGWSYHQKLKNYLFSFVTNAARKTFISFDQFWDVLNIYILYTFPTVQSIF